MWFSDTESWKSGKKKTFCGSGIPRKKPRVVPGPAARLRQEAVVERGSKAKKKNKNRVCLLQEEINNAKIKVAMTEKLWRKIPALERPGSCWKSSAPQNGEEEEEKCAECLCIV